MFVEKIIKAHHAKTDLRVILKDISIEDLSNIEFETNSEDSYDRKIIFCNDSIEIVVMRWHPHDFSAIHNHGHAESGFVKLFTPMTHNIYEKYEDIIVHLKEEKLEANTIIPVDHELIHQMGNPTDNMWGLTLHVYTREENSNSTGVTEDSEIFDILNEEIYLTSGGVFIVPNMNDSKLSSKKGLSGDYKTVQINKEILHNYLNYSPRKLSNSFSKKYSSNEITLQ